MHSQVLSFFSPSLHSEEKKEKACKMCFGITVKKRQEQMKRTKKEKQNKHTHTHTKHFGPKRETKSKGTLST